MTKCFRCGEEQPEVTLVCCWGSCVNEINNEVYCSAHQLSLRKLENDLDDFKAEIARQRISFKKEIQFLQEDRTRLINERDDKVYLVKEKLTQWINLLKKEPKPSK